MDLTETMKDLLSPVVQYGFAGMSVILVGVIVWLIRQLLNVLKETNLVIAQNNQLLTRLFDRLGEMERTTNAMNERLAERPCLADVRLEVSKRKDGTP